MSSRTKIVALCITVLTAASFLAWREQSTAQTLYCFNSRADMTSRILIRSGEVTSNGYTCECAFDQSQRKLIGKWYSIDSSSHEMKYLRSSDCVSEYVK